MRASFQRLPTASPSPSARQDTLAYAADLAVELYALCAECGHESLSASFLDAAAQARRLRAQTYPLDGSANADEPKAT